MASFYNDVEFKSEDAIASLFTSDIQALLGGAQILLSMASEVIDDVDQVAIIAEEFVPHVDPPRTGNFSGTVKIKIVTSFDKALPGGFTDRRALHRQRCGIVRDTLMVTTLDTDLSAAVADFTVQGFDFGRIHQRIVGRAWITEWSVILQSVCGSDL